MTPSVTSAFALAALALLAAPVPVAAQKSKNTLRMAFLEATQSTDPYMDPKPENNFLGHGIFDTLITYDETDLRFMPLLAKSFTRIDDKTFEFELRDDVKWSDGEKFDADDVVYTMGWVTDPATKLRFQADWAFIAGAEKLDVDALATALRAPGVAAEAPGSIDAIVERVAEIAASGDTVVAMSNGEFGRIHERILGRLAVRVMAGRRDG